MPRKAEESTKRMKRLMGELLKALSDEEEIPTYLWANKAGVSNSGDFYIAVNKLVDRGLVARKVGKRRMMYGGRPTLNSITEAGLRELQACG